MQRDFLKKGYSVAFVENPSVLDIDYGLFQGEDSSPHNSDKY